MTDRYTAAHWGAYRVREVDGDIRLDPLADDPAPSQIGRGWLSAARDPRARIQRPAIRKGWLDGDRGAARNDDVFVEVSWDEALDLAARELDRVRQQHGNGAIYGGSYGWSSAGRFHHAQSQLRRFLNLIGGYVAARDTYSHAAGEVILPHITGMTNKDIEEGMTSWPLIARHCTLFLAFGGVSGRTAQIAAGGTSRHEVDDWMAQAAANGMKTISVSPLRSDLADLPNARWLPVRAGSDTALILALVYELVAGNRHDQAFLDRCTSGWDQFRAYVMGETDGQPKSAQWAAPLCDLAAEDIRALAGELADNRVMVAVNWGLQRAHHGEQTVWAGLALAAVLGQIGQPGTGFGFGYGSTTPPGRAKRFISWPSVPQGRNPVDDFIPVARIADMLLNPGKSYAYNGETRQYPDIRLVYWAGGNPFHHHQDLLRLEQAWQRPETVIVHDHSWTATARRADIVLPTTMPLEREDIMINRRDPSLIYMAQVLPPMGEARNDHAIFKGLAQRFAAEQEFTEGRSDEGWLRWLWAGCQGVAQTEGFALPDFERFRETGRFEMSDQDTTRVLFDQFVSDPEANPLATESGRLTLFNDRIAGMQLPDCPGHPCWMEPAEWTLAAAPDELHLLSQQPATRLHSQLDNGSEAAASKLQGREVARMHPATAARLNLREGEVVHLHNARGGCLAGLGLDADMRRDCIVLPTGAWADLQNTAQGRICVHGNPNMLTIDLGASQLSQGNISHTALVRVSPWDAALPPLRALDAPGFVTRRESEQEV
ncbi:molybdopterin-dependent oxidoreductase [Paracoccus sp. Z330]|uniref:Molybdopterin-dependent oxidoreductase n=1 Tax=Paracoccus onchidii TaxID=3017813 RepID=A0ABT4ZDC6_9RHOB|nr:molybdopterin-dependent oxidoreductase [Paracoccus onchidii]MDB6177274.1 molybdopterin-dependent oxidoreductase [Paracoccus onchidii]